MSTKLALMLVLVKCYDNKMVTATPHLFHPFVDQLTNKKKYLCKNVLSEVLKTMLFCANVIKTQTLSIQINQHLPCHLS